MAIFAAIWNGVTWTFLGFAITNVVQNGFRWWMIAPGLFLLPFVLIGLFALGMLVHQLLALLGPPVEATIDRETLQPGATAEVTWRIRGGMRRIERTWVMLEGEELAKYRQGTDTKTATHVFHRTILLDTTDPTERRSGVVRIDIPGDAMHSFKSSNNSITWRIRVHAEIRRWPDIARFFDVRVDPGPGPAEATA
jgi:hypothetical protein